MTEKESLRVQKAEWIGRQIKRQREIEDETREQLFEERRILNERNSSIEKDMACTKELRRYNAEYEEELNAQVYALHGITEDKIEGMKEYRNAYYQGIALAFFLLSAIFILLCGYLHGFDEQITLFMMACTGIEAALLPKKGKRSTFFDVICRILYLLFVPVMFVMFVCYELDWEEYDLLLPIFVIAGIVILVFAACTCFFYNPYRPVRRRLKEAKSDMREIGQSARKAVRKNQKSRSREENRYLKQQKQMEKKEEQIREKYNNRKKGAVSLLKREQIYTDTQLIRIAKRENNNKRNYLIINRLQGKYLPAAPAETIKMFQKLAEKIPKKYAKQHLLVIGFAETATAVGAVIASELNADYIQTTRESIEGASYLEFTEEHSHASEQKLVKNDLDQLMDNVDHILFVDDEITTGNTILNLIDVLKKEYGSKFSFAAAAIINGMDEVSLKRFADNDISCYYLVKADNSSYSEDAERFLGDGIYKEKDTNRPECQYRTIEIRQCSREEEKDIRNSHETKRCDRQNVNARRLVSGPEYKKICDIFWKQLNQQISFAAGERVLVLGTEEFMYPALYAASEIEKMGAVVCFYATGRNPIAVSSEPEYPLHVRYELASLYDPARRTFLYDIGTYDKVCIITDAKENGTDGIYSLINALDSCHNNEILLIKYLV